MRWYIYFSILAAIFVFLLIVALELLPLHIDILIWINEQYIAFKRFIF